MANMNPPIEIWKRIITVGPMEMNIDEKEYRTRDKNLVILLFATGHTTLGTETSRAGIKTFRFLREEIDETLKSWLSNRPIPLIDARSFIIAMELFNSYVRDDEFFFSGR